MTADSLTGADINEATLGKVEFAEEAHQAPVAGLQRVVAYGCGYGYEGAHPTAATAECPPGKKVVGSGGEVATSQPDLAKEYVGLNAIAPSADLTKVVVRARMDWLSYEDRGLDSDEVKFTVKAIALCARTP